MSASAVTVIVAVTTLPTFIVVLGILTAVIAGPTALEITVVVLFMASTVPSFTTMVKVVVSDVDVLLSVGLNTKALSAVCIAAAVLLVIV